MARSLSLHKRRRGIMDITLRVRPGVKEYQFAAAANFDAAFTKFETVPAAGLLTPGALNSESSGSQFRGLTRFLFNPDDYTAGVAAVDDMKPFWIQVTPVDWAGAPGAAEAPHLFLPYSSTPNRAYNVSGTISTSTFEIQLPGLSSGAVIEVDGADNVYVAFDPNGDEFRVPSLSVDYADYHSYSQTFSQLFLRGSALSTAFHASLRLVNSPLT
jgi:hypothetical protein